MNDIRRAVAPHNLICFMGSNTVKVYEPRWKKDDFLILDDFVISIFDFKLFE